MRNKRSPFVVKKILKIISISLLLIFSFSSTYASEGYIERLLDLNIGIEKYDLELQDIEYINFIDYKNKKLFIEFNRINKLLKDEIIRKYRNGDFEYYQVKGIIRNQKMFTYHTNRFFYYTNLSEKYPDNIEIKDFALKHYKLSRTYYNRMKRLVYR